MLPRRWQLGSWRNVVNSGYNLEFGDGGVLYSWPHISGRPCAQLFWIFRIPNKPNQQAPFENFPFPIKLAVLCVKTVPLWGKSCLYSILCWDSRPRVTKNPSSRINVLNTIYRGVQSSPHSISSSDRCFFMIPSAFLGIFLYTMEEIIYNTDPPAALYEKKFPSLGGRKQKQRPFSAGQLHLSSATSKKPSLSLSYYPLLESHGLSWFVLRFLYRHWKHWDYVEHIYDGPEHSSPSD